MTKYITATIVVERLLDENRSLFVQGHRLSLLLEHLSACDRETVILEGEIRYLEGEIQRLRLQIQHHNVEINRLRAVVHSGGRSC
jgi:hypothetical protein